MAKQIIGNSSADILANVVNLTTDPTAPKHATTKSYVDSKADKNFIFYQSSAASTWNVNHNMGKMPAVVVVDSGDTTIIGDITYIDTNNIVLTFAFPFAGKAYLN